MQNRQLHDELLSVHKISQAFLAHRVSASGWLAMILVTI
jgi:hypothetical protein